MNLVEIRSCLSSDLSLKLKLDGTTKPSSVLVVIYGLEPKILMTKKSEILKLHAGQISFPGGKWDEKDKDLLETAIRETREEINLEIKPEQIMGQLKPVTTRNSGYMITPFIAVIDNLSILKQNLEIDTILHIPLIPFLKTLADDKDPNHQSIEEMYTFNFKDFLVWGASARILKQIFDILKKNNIIQDF